MRTSKIFLGLFLRLFLFLLIFGPLYYLGFLNQGYFLQTASLHLSLTQPEAIAFSYDTPAFSNAFYWIMCLLAGLLLAVIFSLPEKFRSEKKIKILNNKHKAQAVEIAHLKQSVQKFQRALLNLPPTTEVAETIEEPAETIEEPVETIEEPVKTIEEPIETIEKPIETIEEPAETIEEPVETIEEPVETIEKPVETIEKPVLQHSIVKDTEQEDQTKETIDPATTS
jgi:hypothetical protein